MMTPALQEMHDILCVITNIQNKQRCPSVCRPASQFFDESVVVYHLTRSFRAQSELPLTKLQTRAMTYGYRYIGEAAATVWNNLFLHIRMRKTQQLPEE